MSAADQGNAALPCIVCGTDLEKVWSEPVNLPLGGLSFRSSGHYGSAAFDPLAARFLEVNVCDPCIRAAAKKGQVLLGRQSRIVETKYMGTWDGESDDNEVGPLTGSTNRTVAIYPDGETQA